MEAGEAEARARETALRWRPLLLSVLRRTGPWTIQEARDVLDDFTSHRLADALRTYRPERGVMAPWLAAVFRNHAVRWKLRSNREAKQFKELAEDILGVEPGEPEGLDPTSLRATFAELDEPRRSVLTAYFRRSKGGLSDLAKELGCSWHRARRMLLEALSEMVRRLADRGAITASSARGALLLLRDGLTPSEAAEYLRVDLAELQEETATLISYIARTIRECDEAL